MIGPSQRPLPDSNQYPQFQQASSRTATPLYTAKLEAEPTQYNSLDRLQKRK